MKNDVNTPESCANMSDFVGNPSDHGRARAVEFTSRFGKEGSKLDTTKLFLDEVDGTVPPGYEASANFTFDDAENYTGQGVFDFTVKREGADDLVAFVTTQDVGEFLNKVEQALNVAWLDYGVNYPRGNTGPEGERGCFLTFTGNCCECLASATSCCEHEVIMH